MSCASRFRVVGARSALVAIATLAGVVLATAPAQAHNQLQSTTPKAGATVAAVPAAVALRFDEPAVKLGTAVRVVGPSGVVSVGRPVLVDNGVRQPLRAGAPAGRYTVSWRVTSVDGHPISGTYAFTAKAASEPTAAETRAVATTTPVAAPSDSAGGDESDDGGTDGRVVLLAGVLGALGGTAIVLVRRRRQRSS